MHVNIWTLSFLTNHGTMVFQTLVSTYWLDIYMWESKFISASTNPKQNSLCLPSSPPPTHTTTITKQSNKVTLIFLPNLFSYYPLNYSVHTHPYAPHPHSVTISCLFCWISPFFSVLLTIAFLQVLTSCLNCPLPASLPGSSHTLLLTHHLHKCLA